MNNPTVETITFSGDVLIDGMPLQENEAYEIPIDAWNDDGILDDMPKVKIVTVQDNDQVGVNP